MNLSERAEEILKKSRLEGRDLDDTEIFYPTLIRKFILKALQEVRNDALEEASTIPTNTRHCPAETTDKTVMIIFKTCIDIQNEILSLKTPSEMDAKGEK